MATECMQGLDQCKYIVKTTIQVIDSEDDRVVDDNLHSMNIGLTYNEAMALKYLQSQKCVEAGASAFIKVVDENGDFVKALKG